MEKTQNCLPLPLEPATVENLKRFSRVSFENHPVHPRDQRNISDLLKLLDEECDVIVDTSHMCGVIYWPGCNHVNTFHVY